MGKFSPPPSDSKPMHVVDAGDLRKYRTELPNLVDDLKLSLFAYRLYGHLKRRAGAEGTTIEGLRSMAKHCKMAVGTAAKARRELIDRQLITTEEVVNDRGRFERITIIDIWEQNFLHYAEMRRRKEAAKSKPLSDGVCRQTARPPVSPDDTPGVPLNEQDVLPDGTPPVSPDDTLKKEPREERTNGERTTPTPRASASPSSNGNGSGTRVSVPRSKFSYQERLTFARNQQGIDKPQAYANSKPAREGEFDEAIQAWVDEQHLPVGAKPERDTSACPDCRGSGFSYPKGPAGGVVKCRHPQLADVQEGELQST
jgi:hypothetical protein